MKLVEIGDDYWAFEDLKIDLDTHKELDEAIDFLSSGDFIQSEGILKNIIGNNSCHIDAYYHLSLVYEDMSRDLEAYLCCREAARIGLSAMPKKFDWRKSKLEWLVLDNRPFLRAYNNLGLWHEKRRETSLAIEVCERILSVCPNDNLGVRYLLPRLCFEQEDTLGAIRICKAYEGDSAPEILYSYALAMVLAGEKKKAAQLIKVAENALPLVAKELKKKHHPKPKSYMPGYITHGGADQAYEYWLRYGKYWEESKDAMSMLDSV